MLDGSYVVEVDTPLGKKEGAVELKTSGAQLNISVDAPTIRKQTAVGTATGSSFTVEGTLKLLLIGKVPYTIEGNVSDDGILTATLKSSKGDFAIMGARVE